MELFTSEKTLKDLVVIGICDVMTMVCPEYWEYDEATGRHGFQDWDYEQTSEWVMGFCKSNNLDYFAFPGDERYGAKWKGLELAEAKGYDGVVLENLS